MSRLKQIETFVAVASRGSLVGAARAEGVAAAVVGRRLDALEERLGVKLMLRTTRKLSLTDAGRTLFDQCAAQIDALHAAANDLAGESQTPKGNIRVAASAGFFDFFEMEWVKEFLHQYPSVQLEFVLSDGMADFIGEGIDVAFRGSSELPDSSLIARKLAAGYLALAASPAYLAARGTPRTVEDLSAHDCIRAIHPGAIPNNHTIWRLQGPEGSSHIHVSGRFSANTGPALKKAAIGGLGICLLPTGSLEESFRSGELVQVLPGVACSVGNLYVVYPSRRHVPRAVTAFVEMAVQRIGAWMQVNAVTAA